jgi:hypothetical protein
MDESKYEFFRTFVGHQSFVCQYKKEIGTFFLLASHWCLPIVCIGFRKLDVLFVLQRSGMCNVVLALLKDHVLLQVDDKRPKQEEDFFMLLFGLLKKKKKMRHSLKWIHSWKMLAFVSTYFCITKNS